MRLVDLTLPVPAIENDSPTVALDEWPISGPGFSYTGMVYRFNHWSMSGTYIDFPGHIKHLDDGANAENYPLEKLFDIPSVVIHIDRSEKPGKIRADELQAACLAPVNGGGLIIHALGTKRYAEVPERSVALAKDAVDWMVDRGIHLVVSDVYEHSDEPENIFSALFSGGISAVCRPCNLDKLDAPTVRLSVLTLRFPNVTQAPCRAVARITDPGEESA